MGRGRGWCRSGAGRARCQPAARTVLPAAAGAGTPRWAEPRGGRRQGDKRGRGGDREERGGTRGPGVQRGPGGCGSGGGGPQLRGQPGVQRWARGWEQPVPGTAGPFGFAPPVLPELPRYPRFSPNRSVPPVPPFPPTAPRGFLPSRSPRCPPASPRCPLPVPRLRPFPVPSPSPSALAGPASVARAERGVARGRVCTQRYSREISPSPRGLCPSVARRRWCR